VVLIEMETEEIGMSLTKPLVHNGPSDWSPSIPHPVPLFVWPPRPLALIKWIFGYPGYLLPWTMGYMAISIVTWLYLTPDMARMKSLDVHWIGFIFVRNLTFLVLIVGSWHLRLYVQRAQGTDFKFNARWLAKNNAMFIGGSQVFDNIFWTTISAVPTWTAYEVLMLWAYANGHLPYIDWRAHPLYCTLLILAIPILHEVHFYCIHRLIHWPPIYRAVHKLHHKNVNTGPWSGLAMHPIEHLLYFSGVLIYWIIPSNPLHTLFHLQTAAFTPAQGHAGFERLVIKGSFAIEAGDYFHYLHHKFFECNYGGERVPLDRWFGTFHDGSKEAEKAMSKRFLARQRRAQ
jgi:sterol desaturase/sphingolipid hydroxylase (fatty acid hydroxylase superfamily)